jgi:hypothetical protein
MKPGVLVLMATLCGWGLAGCQTNYTQPIAPPATLTAEQLNFEATWLASLEVLRKYNFVIDREDRRAGVITTRPLVGRHWFELWRHDAVGECNMWESTLQTIYRTATVRICPTAQGAGTYSACVEVQTSRSDRPSRQMTSAAEAYSMFLLPGIPVDQSLLPDPATEEPETKAEAARGVVHLGPDPLLSERLTGQINCAAGQRILAGNLTP